MLRRGVGVGALKKREQTQVPISQQPLQQLQHSCPMDRLRMAAGGSSLTVSALSVCGTCLVDQQTYKEMGAKLEESQMQHVR